MVFVGQIEEGKVILATGAINRLRERKAAKVLDQIAEKFVGLSEMPERGVYPKELIALGIRD